MIYFQRDPFQARRQQGDLSVKHIKRLKQPSLPPEALDPKQQTLPPQLSSQCLPIKGDSQAFHNRALLR